jgi:hypothetical protein
MKNGEKITTQIASAYRYKVEGISAVSASHYEEGQVGTFYDVYVYRRNKEIVIKKNQNHRFTTTFSATQSPRRDHIVQMLFPPVVITHRIPTHWADAAMNGDMRTPTTVAGTHNFT